MDKKNKGNQYISIYEIGEFTPQDEFIPDKEKFRRNISNPAEFTSL